MKLLEKESRMKEKQRMDLENKMVQEKKDLELLIEKMLRKNYALQEMKQGSNPQLDGLAEKQKTLLAEITNEIQDHRKVVTKIEKKEQNRLVVELSTIESENFEDSKNEELKALEEIENEKARLNFASISLDSEKLKLEEKKREVAELVEKVKRQSEQLNEKQSALIKSKELEKKQR